MKFDEFFGLSFFKFSGIYKPSEESSSLESESSFLPLATGAAFAAGFLVSSSSETHNKKCLRIFTLIPDQGGIFPRWKKCKQTNRMHKNVNVPSSEDSSEDDSAFFPLVLAAATGFVAFTSSSEKKNFTKYK